MEHVPRDARALLTGLVGREISTLTGRPNTVLRVDDYHVIVATEKSPKGQPVPIDSVQSALDRLIEDGQVEISVPSVGYRSAFIGAVLSTLPGANSKRDPLRVQLRQLG